MEIIKKDEMPNYLIKKFYEKHRNEGYVIIEDVPTKELEVGDIVCVTSYNSPYLIKIDLILIGKKWAIINDVWIYEYDKLNVVLRKGD